MKKAKTISNFRTVQHGYTETMIPVADAESQVIMELNFWQFVGVLSDILVRHAADEETQNFKMGQAEGVHPCLQNINDCFAFCIVSYIKIERRF